MFERSQQMRGFTLAEMLVVTTIFPILFLTLYSLVNASSVIIYTNDIFSKLNYNALQTLRHVSREVSASSENDGHFVVTTDVNNNSVIRFQIPVDWDNDSDVIADDPEQTVEWGAYDQVGLTEAGTSGNPLSRWTQYSVLQDPNDATNFQLVRDVLSGALTPILSLRRVIANAVVQTGGFTVTDPDQNMVTITLTLTDVDTKGAGGAGRTLEANFSNQTMLQN